MSPTSHRRHRSLRDIDPSDVAFAALIAVLFVLVGTTFQQYAVSNDEGLQHHYGELIIAYYRSGFADRSVFDFENLYLYGGLFDIIAVLLAHALPFDVYDIRHVMSAVAGIGGIVATWATARMIAGARAGLFAGLALTLCGVWYGGMFNHTKDVPFASAMMGAAFFLLRAERDRPHPRWCNLLSFGIMLGAGLGLRATGLLMCGYAAATIAVRSCAARQQGWRPMVYGGVVSFARYVPAFMVGYLIMILSWPWAWLEIFNPLRAIFAFAHFHYPIRTVIAGDVYLMSDVPRWYEPTYLTIKLPLFVLICAAAALPLRAWLETRRAMRPRKGALPHNHVYEIGCLLFLIVFPLSCQVIGHGPSFTGMRHFLFVVPPIAALGGIGAHLFVSLLEPRGRAAGMTALAGVTVAFGWVVVALVQLHPYEYLFYNSLIGGLEGASGRYVMDYWVNIMPAAVKDLETFLDRTDTRVNLLRPRPYTVAVCGERVSFENEADRRLQFTADWSHADFFIAPTHMNCDRVLEGKTVDVIERVGVAIGVVKDLRGISPQARWAPVEVAGGAASKPATARKPRG